MLLVAGVTPLPPQAPVPRCGVCRPPGRGRDEYNSDGTSIAFDAIRPHGSWNLYSVAADVRRVQQHPAELVSRWPVDLLCIRSHQRLADLEDAIGGRKARADHSGGGREPVVSYDGGRVYYAKSPPIQGIWEVPAEGGQEVQIVFGRGSGLNFDVAENGIFMIDPAAKPQATVEMFSFASRQIVPVARLPPGVRVQGASYLTVTRDGCSMLCARFDQWESDIDAA